MSRRPARAWPTIALATLAWLALAASARDAAAHDLRPGVLALVEVAPTSYEVRFVAPIDSRGDVVDVTIELPAGCARDDARLRCPAGLTGTLAVRGMRGDAMRTIIQLERRDGSRAEWIVGAADPRVTLDAPPPRTWSSWVRLGVHHIFGGLDHLAFVIGLLLVLDLAISRRLLLSITAFTIAHSLTLALAVLGVLDVAAAPVEACIAASVLLVAREATHRAPTVTRRRPWLVAGGFGLIHGLGFAGALGGAGLSPTSVVSSLVWFNAGVELGQLAVVAAVVVLAWAGRRLLARWTSLGPRLQRAACYALGALAAWWFVERVALIALGAPS